MDDGHHQELTLGYNRSAACFACLATMIQALTDTRNDEEHESARRDNECASVCSVQCAVWIVLSVRVSILSLTLPVCSEDAFFLL